MKNTTIEELAYILEQAKEKKQPKPIFFLGAGASKSGGIPLAKDIVKDILDKYSKAPAIKNLKEEDRSYSKLMNCLQPYERDTLLKGYIDKAKINVTHIYLAQLMENDFVDYVLTVNFDNLMLRALSLFNEFPSTYDMAILKDFTTTTFKEKSVVYLHGQHHGLWLLNTEEEMKKVSASVQRIFDSIKNKRPWIFIGYSGDDPIFEHIKNMGRFDNGLYWVGYKENDPSEKVKKFLKTENTNSSIIKGYDSDSFMLKLNTELKLPQPAIIDKPFTSIKEMLNNIVDIDDDEHFKGVKERLKISKEQVTRAINQFEEGNVSSKREMKKKSDLEILKKEVINLIIEEEFDEVRINEIKVKTKLFNNKELNDLIAYLYLEWGNYFGNLAKSSKSIMAEELYNKAFDKYEIAITFNPKFNDAYYNWGTELGNLAKSKEGKEVDIIFQDAFEKYTKSIDIKGDDYLTFYNWGIDLLDFAETKDSKEADEFYKEAVYKFKSSINLKSDNYKAYINWGISLAKLAKTKEAKESEKLYIQAFDKFKKALEIKPSLYEGFANWGNYLAELARMKKGKELDEFYVNAFDKYLKATIIKPNCSETYSNWGVNLVEFADTQKGEKASKLYEEAIIKLEKAIYLKPDAPVAYYNLGFGLFNYAETYFDKEKGEKYNEAIYNLRKAVDLKFDYHEALNLWGYSLTQLACLKKGLKASELFNMAIDKYNLSIKYGGSYYNLACTYSIRGDKKNALYNLDISLSKNEQSIIFINNDEDWKDYYEDFDFIKLMEKHKKEEAL